MTQRRQFLTAAVLSATAAWAAAPVAWAQATWPTKPVKIVVPFSAGSATDLISRQVADGLRKQLGQTFIVENKPGASAAIGADQVARSAADGNTWLMGGPAAIVTNRFLFKKLTYNPADFDNGIMVAVTPNILLTRPDAPYKNIAQLVAYAKAHPDKLTYASFGTGTTSQLAGELFKQAAGVDILHIPYKGAGDAIPALISGDVSLYFDTIMTAMPQVKAGKLVALGISTASRSPQAPGVATIAEQGVPGFDIAPWYALVPPKGTDPAIVAKMHGAVQKLFEDAEFRKKFESTGAEKYTMSVAEYKAFVDDQLARTQSLLKAAKIEAQ